MYRQVLPSPMTGRIKGEGGREGGGSPFYYLIILLWRDNFNPRYISIDYLVGRNNIDKKRATISWYTRNKCTI